MEVNEYYNYENSMITLDDVLDLITDAVQNHKPLSIGRYGHGEIAYLGWEDFPQWKSGFDPHSTYAGATTSNETIKADLLEALKTTDIVGFHVSWGEAWEDRGAADLTKVLLQRFDIKPSKVCSAFITHEMINSERFWEFLKNQKVALVGRRAYEAASVFCKRDIDITFTTTLEGYEELEKVYECLYKREDWDIALVSAGIPATVLAPRLANKTNRVVIDFGHALDKLIDGDNFNYLELLKNWKESVDDTILVSVVMSVYNGERFIKDAIDGILAQTYQNIEAVIINNGSTDSTKSILDDIHDERLRVIHLEKNQGAASALNMAIKQAQGTWIAIQDADDISYPNRIEEQINYVTEHPQLVGVGTFIECISEDPAIPESLLKDFAKNRNWYASSKRIRNRIYSECPLTHSSMLFFKYAFWEAGGYNVDYKIAYDYDLWLRLLEKGDIVNVPKVLLKYRINSDSLSYSDSNATANELQVASSRAISRLLKKCSGHVPAVIVMGSQKGCLSYENCIAPECDLKVDAYVYKECDKLFPYMVRKVKEGEVDAIIVLDGYRKEKRLYELKKQLKFNEQVFCIFNLTN